MNNSSFNQFLDIVAILSGLITIINFFMKLYSLCHKNTSKDIFPSIRIYAIVKELNAPQMVCVHNHDSSNKKKTFRNFGDFFIFIIYIILLPLGMFWFQQYKNTLYLYVTFTITSFFIFQLYRIKKHYDTEITFFSLFLYVFSSAIFLFIGYFNLFAPENYMEYLLDSQYFTTLNASTFLTFINDRLLEKPAYFIYFLLQFSSLILLMTDYIKSSISLFKFVLFHKPYVPIESKDLRNTMKDIIILGIVSYGLLYLVQLLSK